MRGVFVIILMMADKKIILLVEDEKLLLNLLKQRLEQEEFDVITAKNGEEALRILKGTKPDLILLDIILPKISGFELMENVRKDPGYGKSPIIIISNLGQESDIERGKALGAVGYFVKAHVSIEDLVGQVKGFFGGVKSS